MAQAKSDNKISEELQECLKLLGELMGHEDAEAFLAPVDWESLKLPDYPVIIKKPMDLGTIKSNIESGKYDDAYDFAEDVRLVWKNAKLYNTPGSPIYVNAESLSQQFERKFPKIKKQFSAKRFVVLSLSLSLFDLRVIFVVYLYYISLHSLYKQ